MSDGPAMRATTQPTGRVTVSGILVSRANYEAALDEWRRTFTVENRGNRFQAGEPTAAQIAIELAVGVGSTITVNAILYVMRGVRHLLRRRTDGKPQRLAYQLTLSDGRRSASASVETDKPEEIERILTQLQRTLQAKDST